MLVLPAYVLFQWIKVKIHKWINFQEAVLSSGDVLHVLKDYEEDQRKIDIASQIRF